MTEHGRRILIVEDEEGIAFTLTMQLKRIHYQPLEAVSYGEQAVERAGELLPDLVLMDISLAGQMDGIEAARLIRERYNLPVIFLSALDEDLVLHDAQSSNPYGYLVKPVKESELKAAVELAMYKHAMEARLIESEERYRLLFNQMNSGFALHQIICDENGSPVDYRFITINPAYEQITGLKADQLVGRTVRDALPDLDSSFFIETLGRVGMTGEPVHFERYVPELRQFFDFKAFSIKHGECALILEDLTEKKKAEDALRNSYAQLEQSLRRMTILRNIDQAIITLVELNTLADTVLNHAIDPMEVDAAALFVPESFGTRVTKGHTDLLVARSPMRLVSSAGFPDCPEVNAMRSYQADLAFRAYYGEKPIYIPDLRQETHPGAMQIFQQTGFTGCAAMPLVAHDLTRGVLQVFRYRFDMRDEGWKNFLEALALQVAIGIDTMEMLDGLRRSNAELSNAYDGTIRALALSLEERGKEAPDHSDRVTDLSTRLAELMGIHGKDLQHFLRGVMLHDFGKIVIPDRILHKTGPLSEEDWITMRQHPEKAYRLLSGIQFLEPGLKVVLYHHEKWDGGGYPHGLKGEEIPIWARIFAVIDVYDALTTPRTYRLAWPKEEALAYIAKESGHHFDPRVAEAFLRMMRN